MKILHVFALAVTAEGFFDGQFKYLVEHGHEIVMVSTPDARVEDFSARNGITYIPMEVPRTISPTADLNAVRKLIAIIKQYRIDIVVGHTPKGALLSMLAAKLAGCSRRVYLRHGLIYTTASGLKRSILKTEERFVSSIATNIINVSQSVGNLVVKDGINKNSKQSVIGRGSCGGIDTLGVFNPSNIDLKKLENLRLTYGISKDDYVIGFCGRLCKDKGIPELIKGFSLLKNKNAIDRVKLLLVGDYDTRDILSPKIHKVIDTDQDIIFTGHITKDIQYFYALMDLFVFPSHREGFGMSSIEAQSMGIPTLVSKSHGCIDTIIDGKSGFYIDITPESICRNILRMYEKRPNTDMSKSAREFVTANFERTSMWPMIKEYYDTL